jgi:hypothetical protein
LIKDIKYFGEEKMRKIYFSLGIVILITISSFGNSFSAKDNIERDGYLVTKNNGSYIPTVCDIILRGKPNNNFDYEQLNPQSTIDNWTEADQKVRIHWKIVNKGYDWSQTIILWVRIREWQYDSAIPLLEFYLRGGKVSTTGNESWFPRIDFPKFIKIPIDFPEDTNTEGYTDIPIHIDRWNDTRYIEIFCQAWVPGKILYGACKGGVIVWHNQSKNPLIS